MSETASPQMGPGQIEQQAAASVQRLFPAGALDPEQASKAKELYGQHRVFSMYLDGDTKDLADNGIDAESIQEIRDGDLTRDKRSQMAAAGNNPSALEASQKKYDANLWRAQQHKEQHLDGYKATANQEAEEQGVKINLNSSKQ